jgi:serine/threonine-protein kinase
MAFCPECGKQTNAGDPFCGECGAPQQIEARQTNRPGTRNVGRTSSMSMSSSGNTPTGLTLAAGTVLADRYKIVKRIGGGGMGSVYRAEDQNLALRTVAVKEMIEMFADDSAREKAIEDFRRESELLARLEHPSIPTVYDYFFDRSRGRYYLVMKFIDGGDLSAKQKAAGGKVDEQTVAKWGLQTCEVLDYVHSQDPPIIYRDLKPANLMLDNRSGRVMLVDFGIARFVSPAQQKGVTAIGTMGYAPPELFAGNVDPRSDIYSLGATMFHLLTGHDPQDKPLLIFDFTKNPKPRQLNEEISAHMEELLCRSVEYKPENRFESAKQFGQELEKHLRLLERGELVTPIIHESAGTSALTPNVQKCYNCQSPLTPNDAFCAFCGQKQPEQKTTARLIVVGTTEMDAQFPLNPAGESLIGRLDPIRGIHPEVDLSRYDPAARVSRRHARIFLQENQYVIEDLNSANGTFVNGQLRLMPKQPHTLTNGDEVRLGETRLKFIAG